jgi:hypothetical protein
MIVPAAGARFHTVKPSGTGCAPRLSSLQRAAARSCPAQARGEPLGRAHQGDRKQSPLRSTQRQPKPLVNGTLNVKPLLTTYANSFRSNAARAETPTAATPQGVLEK